jgi:IS5 family transposase
MRRFAGIELGETPVPDESTILRFRHLLEEHQLTRAIFEQVRALLEERNLYLNLYLVRRGLMPPGAKYTL